MHLTPNQLIQLIIPGIALVFALGFVCAWAYDKRLRYLLFLAASFGSFALGSAAQVAHLPDDWRPNAIISGAFYLLSSQLIAEGVLRRAALRFRFATHAAIFALAMAAMYYFSYVATNLLVRIYILNFGAGFWMLMTAARFRHACNGRTINKILFWALLTCGVSFFVRTSLTTLKPLPHNAAGFAHTVFWDLLQLSLALMGAALGLVLLAATMSDVIDALIVERDHDSLTEVLNRRAFERLAAQRIGDHTTEPLALIAFDIDNFKSINDGYGHPAGDAVLRRFSAMLRAAVRENDLVGRLGGEEFVVLLAGADSVMAYRIAERLRTVLESSSFDDIDAALRVTTSAGVTQHRRGEPLASLLARADRLLYIAKQTGRNKVLTESSTTTLENANINGAI